MAMNFSKLGETKVTVPLILLVSLVWFGWNARDFTIEGLDKFFISEAEGGEMTKQINVLNETMTKFISKSEIRDINDKIQDANDQISDTQLWISANGSNQIARARLADLVKRRDALEATKACILNDNTTDKDNCYVD